MVKKIPIEKEYLTYLKAYHLKYLSHNYLAVPLIPLLYQVSKSSEIDVMNNNYSYILLKY
jgi:hypothetical protein